MTKPMTLKSIVSEADPFLASEAAFVPSRAMMVP